MHKKDAKLGTIIHGIGSSEALDSSGERISIEGIDISRLEADGLANWEHKSDEASQIVGKVIKAKKILKRSDCENDDHRHFWDKIKMPYLYVAIELFDEEGHSGAKDIVAMLKYDGKLDKRKTKQLINFSIEGSRLDKSGSKITKCIARKITITNTPCNKTCVAEEKKPENSKKSDLDNILGKSEDFACEIMKAIPLPEPKREFLSNDVPDKLKVGDRIIHGSKERGKKGKDIYNDPKTFPKPKIKKSKKKKIDTRSNVVKALTASCGCGTSPAETEGLPALSKEKLKEKMVRTCKSIGDDHWNTFTKKEELIDFLTERMPNSSEKNIIAIAKAVAYYNIKKYELSLSEMVKVCEDDLEKAKIDELRHPEGEKGAASAKRKERKERNVDFKPYKKERRTKSRAFPYTTSADKEKQYKLKQKLQERYGKQPSKKDLEFPTLAASEEHKK